MVSNNTAGDSPKQMPAQQKVREAVEKGMLHKPSVCQRCHKGGVKLNSHHYKGYGQPLKVRWLCAACHAVEDPKAREGRPKGS